MKRTDFLRRLIGGIAALFTLEPLSAEPVEPPETWREVWPADKPFPCMGRSHHRESYSNDSGKDCATCRDCWNEGYVYVPSKQEWQWQRPIVSVMCPQAAQSRRAYYEARRLLS